MILKDAFFQRLVMTTMAVACWVLAAILPAIPPAVQMSLIGAGSALLAWAHAARPGDVPVSSLPTSVQRSMRPPMFPPDIPTRGSL